MGAQLSECAAHRALDTAEGYIGFVLRADGGRVDLVVSAIRDDNAGVSLLILDHGSAIEIRTAARLRVTATTLRWHVGRHFGTSDLQSMIISSCGQVTADTDSLAVTEASLA